MPPSSRLVDVAKMRMMADAESKERLQVYWRINRDESKETYYAHSGKQDDVSWRTVLESRSQIKLFAAGVMWYGFQMATYLVLANVLVYLTFHAISPRTPSYPFDVAVNGSQSCMWEHKELFDSGFRLTPDYSNPRPFWLKAMFVDMLVTVAQIVPPIVLFYMGQTYNFVCYVGLVGMMNIMKGTIQIATILPPARGGADCWAKNFPAEQITAIQGDFSTWWFENWGMTHGCNDMLWSGHTSQSCLGLLFIDKALRRCGIRTCVRGLLVVYFLVYIWAVLACRMHYTIDVLVAAGVAVAVFTHTPLRFWIWSFANHLVCNPDTDYEDESESEESDE